MVFQNGLVKALLIKPFEPTMTNTNIRHDKRDVIWVIIPYVGSKSDALLQLLQRKVKLKFRITQATQKLSFYVNMKDHVPGMFSWKLAFESFSRGSKTFWPRHSQSLVRGPDKKPSCSNNDFFNIQTLLIQIGLSLWSKKRYILNLEALKELQLFNWFIMSFNHVSYIPLPWFLITAFKCFNLYCLLKI